MKIIQGDRGVGKTTRMISWFVHRHEHRGIIVPNHQQRRFVMKEIVRLFPVMGQAALSYDGSGYVWGRNIWTPLTALQRRRGLDIEEIWVDNFDMILRDITGGGPITLTTSEEVELEEI